MGIKQYVYHCRPPKAQEAAIRDQIKLAGRYRNKLVELELARRKAVEEQLRIFVPEYQVAEAALEAARLLVEDILADVKKNRSVSRKRVAPTPEQKAALAAAKVARKAAAEAFKTIKAAAFARQDLQTALKQTTEAHHAATKAARAASGLYWGNYLIVEDAAKSFGKGAPPRFMRSRGTGSVAVQLQNGMPVAALHEAQDSRLQLSLPPGLEERLATVGKARQSHGFASLRIRIGSDEYRKPIFAELPVVLHRPLPADGVIKWAFVSLNRTASTEDWSVRFMVDAAQPARPELPGVVAVHLGYRMLSDGSLRVATALDHEGRMRELCLSAKEVGWLQKESDLQSIRDKEFDLVRLRLTNWLKGLVSTPEWLKEATETLHAWKSADRLASLVKHWRDNRLEGDTAMYEELEAWRKQDKHLWLWHGHGTAKQIRRRADLYRCFAKELAKTYGTCVVANVVWKDLMQKGPTERTDDIPAAVRRRARLASPGLLTQYLKEAFTTASVVMVPANHISTECSVCGGELVGHIDRIVSCEACGNIDQDHNAVKITLRDGLAAIAARTPGSEAEAKPKLSVRQARFREAKARKKEQGTPA